MRWTLLSPRDPPAPATDWLEFAQGDLAAACACAASEAAPGWTIGFHCQQAVEKAYKGAIADRGQPPPRTHDLVRLDEQVHDLGLQPPLAVERLELLFPFAIHDKYPRLHMSPIPRADAIGLIEDARQAVDWLAVLVGIGGAG